MPRSKRDLILALKRAVSAESLMTPVENLFSCKQGDQLRQLETMDRRKYDLAPWKVNTDVTGFILRRDPRRVSASRLDVLVSPVGSFASVQAKSEMHELLRTLRGAPAHVPVLVVMEGAKVVGLIHFVDLNRPALRLYLFALIGEFEYNLAKCLSRRDPEDLRRSLWEESTRREFKKAEHLEKKDNQDDRNLDLPYYFGSRLLVELASLDPAIMGLLSSDAPRFRFRYSDLPRIRNDLMHPKKFIRVQGDIDTVLSIAESIERDLFLLLDSPPS